MLHELDVVQLKTAQPDLGLEAGVGGTVLSVYGGGEVVVVEFVDDTGRTLSVSPVNAENLVLEVSAEVGQSSGGRL